MALEIGTASIVRGLRLLGLLALAGAAFALALSFRPGGEIGVAFSLGISFALLVASVVLLGFAKVIELRRQPAPPPSG